MKIFTKNKNNSSSEVILFQGYLEKKGPFNTSKKFWFELTNDNLRNFNDEKKGTCRSVYPIEYTTVVVPLESRQHSFSITFKSKLSKKVLVLKAIDVGEELQWIDELDKVIRNKSASRSIINKIPTTDSNIDESSDLSSHTDKNQNSTGFPIFLKSNLSAVAQVLTGKASLYAQLNGFKTKYNFTIDDVIQPGVDLSNLDVGCVAGDEECYFVFKPLYDAIIELRRGYGPLDSPKTDLDVSHLPECDVATSPYILSSRVSVIRNISGLALPPRCSRSERRQIEELLQSIFLQLPEDCRGSYRSLQAIPSDEYMSMIRNHLLFEKPADDSLLQHSGCSRDWPDARGAFISDANDLSVWVNERDHLKVLAVETGGGDLARAFRRLSLTVGCIEERLREAGGCFMYDEHFGYLSTCPCSVGSGLEASVVMKLKHLSKNVNRLKTICTKLGLIAAPFDTTSSSGNHDNSSHWELSCEYSIECSEVELVHQLSSGLSQLIALEKCLEAGIEVGFNALCANIPSTFAHPVIESGRQVEEEKLVVDLPSPLLGDYPVLNEKHTSLLARHLTPEIYAALSQETTSFGYTLSDAIRVGIDCPDQPLGITAGDEESWYLFREILEPVLAEWHGCAPEHLLSQSLDESALTDVADIDQCYVAGSQIALSRNLVDYAYSPCISRGQRRALEQVVVAALARLEGEMSGEYILLSELARDQEAELVARGLSVSKPLPDSLLSGCGGGRDWPDGRGVFEADSYQLLVLVNFLDHIQIVLTDQTSNVKYLLGKLKVVLSAVEKALSSGGVSFQHSSRIGFPTACPSLAGTALHVNMTLRLPLLGDDDEQFLSLCHPLGLEARRMPDQMAGTTTSKTTSYRNCHWEVTNKACLGITEVDVAQLVVDGVNSLIEMEKKIEAGMSISTFLPPSLVHSDLPFFRQYHTSAMAKVLSKRPKIYARLRGLITKNGFTIDDVIQPGVDLPNLDVGCVAGDEECYFLFKPLYDAVIELRRGYGPLDSPKTDLDVSHLPECDVATSPYILSSRVSVIRNVSGLALPPRCSRSERRQIEELLQSIFLQLPEDCRGSYRSLQAIPSDEYMSMIRNHLLFEKPSNDSLLQHSGCSRDWPDARGAFISDANDLSVWVNERDHLKVLAVDTGGGDLARAFRRLSLTVGCIEERLREAGGCFMYDEHFGYLSTCPCSVGSGLEASVVMKLNHLGLESDRLKGFCGRLGMLARLVVVSASGDGSESYRWELSSTVGGMYSEADAMRVFMEGVQVIVELEQHLEQGELEDFERVYQSIPEDYYKTIITTESSQIYQSPDTTVPPSPSSPSQLQLTNCSSFPRFSPRHKSIMTKHLTPAIYTSLENKITKFGYTLSDAIRVGIDCPDQPLGITAGDEESWYLFREILEPVLAEWHGCAPEHLLSQSLDESALTDVADIDQCYVAGSQIALSRNLVDYAYSPCISRGQRRALEQVVVAALARLEGEMSGEYSSLSDVDDFGLLRCIGVPFEKPATDSWLGGSGGGRDWPDARGVFHDESKSCIVTVNLEDHLRILTRDSSSDIHQIIVRFKHMLSAIEKALALQGTVYQWNDTQGYLTTCPSLLGTAMQVSYFLKLPNAGVEEDKLLVICDQLGLKVRRVPDNSEETSSVMYDEDIWEVYNKRSLGLTETAIVQLVVNGVNALIDIDKKVASGTSISSFLPQKHRKAASGVYSGAATTVNNPPVVSETDRGLQEFEISHRGVFEGELVKKKLTSESSYKQRFIWIDVQTLTFHWSKSTSKTGKSKSLAAADIDSVTSPQSITKNKRQSFFGSSNEDTQQKVLWSITLKDKKKKSINIKMSVGEGEEAAVVMGRASDWVKVLQTLVSEAKAEEADEVELT